MPASSPSSLALVAAGCAALIAPLVIVAPAAAATFTVGSTSEFLDALVAVEANSLSDTIEVDPGLDLDFANATVEITEPLVIELNGSTVRDLRPIVTQSSLTIRGGTWISRAIAAEDGPGIGVAAGASLTLDSATVTADGGCAAGIGGYVAGGTCSGSVVVPGQIIITDSTVTATGGFSGTRLGAGIGVYTGTGGSVLIEGSSTVTATAGYYAAGIGGGQYTGPSSSAGQVTITGGTVNATGGLYGAGIGGGEGRDGGAITISGGTVTAIGGGFASGVGGGAYRGAGTVQITGGTVEATAGLSNEFQGAAAGIGAGAGSGLASAGSITLSGGAVSATGTNATAGIGDAGLTETPVTPLVIDGEVSLSTEAIRATGGVEPGARLLIVSGTSPTIEGSFGNEGVIEIESTASVEIPTSQSFTNAGRIDGSGDLIGEGELINDGSICAVIDDEATNPEVGDDSGLTVSGNAFYLPYLYPEGFTVGNSVYADTFEAGCRSMPDVSRLSTDGGAPLINVGWTLTEDGSGPFLTMTDSLSAAVTENPSTLYPTMVEAVLKVTASPSPAVVGQPVTITTEGPWPLSNSTIIDLTDRAVIGGGSPTSARAAGHDLSITDAFVGASAGSLTFTEPGVKTVTVSVDYYVESQVTSVTAEGTVTVTPAAGPELAATGFGDMAGLLGFGAAALAVGSVLLALRRRTVWPPTRGDRQGGPVHLIQSRP